MKAAYFPFTCLSESDARLLDALAGPVVVYQPIKTAIPSNIGAMASRGCIEVRTPMTGDDDRLRAALAEFAEWGRLNPGKWTPGPDFIGARQGDVPFYDESAVSRIRSEIKHYHESGRQTGEPDDGFSARLFLALAQENDLAVESLDHDLDRFKALEKDFLATLEDAGDAAFNRRAYKGRLWREDPGARLTGQRIRAWARLVSSDGELPHVLVTTSPAVVEALMEIHGDESGFETLATLRLPVPSDDSAPVLDPVLNTLAAWKDDPPSDLSMFNLPLVDEAAEASITATFYMAADCTPAAFIGRLTPAAAAPPQPFGQPTAPRHTLMVLLEG